jgi:hypothetical protein
MPGQPAPPVLVEAFAKNAPNASPAAPQAGGKTNPFPAASQIAVTNGAASLDDGFPPLSMTAPSAGGIPPFGEDMNGILYLLSAHLAFLNAGQKYTFNAALVVAMGGYAVGAVLQQANDPTEFWINIVAGNSTNPDTASPLGSTGWMSTKPLNVVVAPAAGASNDIVLPGASDYIYDVNCAAGAISLTGFVPQRDGQRLTIRKVDASANGLTLPSLTGSAVGHQLQVIAGGIGLPLQYMAVRLCFNATVNAWVQE